MMCARWRRSRTCTLKNIAMTLAAVGPLHRHVVDVALRVGDRRGEVGEQPAPVGDEQPDAGVEHALDVGRPFDVDELLGVAALLLAA